MGAAILSGIGLGVYKNGKDAAVKLKTAHRYIKRDEDISRKYDYLYKNAYVKLYNAIKPVNDVLSAYDL
jgi:ribulose kinase